MWVAIGFFQGDAHLAKALVSWIKQLDGNLSQGALLVADPGVDWGVASECLKIASDVFQRVEIITAGESWQSWPAGPNALFKRAAQFFQDRHIGPWLWLEPDAIPLKVGWLDKIEQEYFVSGKPFMGSLMEAKEPNMPAQYLPGIAVYPMDAWKRMSLVWQEDKAFDVATASVTVPIAANTSLIQHFWGQKDLPPTFVAEKTSESPVNAFTLESIKPEAVVFHRNKDGSLLRLLGYLDRPEALLNVVLPFCWNDAQLMLKNITWMARLHSRKQVNAIIHHDQTVPPELIDAIRGVARKLFEVRESKYSSKGATGWPVGPNRAFVAACQFMERSNFALGWIWLEPDAVPVRRDWIECLSSEYERAGKPFMGTIIGGMGHMNGVGVYPPIVREFAPSIARPLSTAWDVALMQEIAPLTHRANHLIQHCRAMINSCCVDSHGEPPVFRTQQDVDSMVDNGVAVFHPSKDGSLINFMLERLPH